jgi:STE24 endopeptidase
MRNLTFCIAILAAAFLSCVANADTPPPATPAFDVHAAVQAYLDKMPESQRAKSNAYFEGGYWLLLWDFTVASFVLWLMLRFRWSARIRDLAERITHIKWLQTAIYSAQFIVVFSVLTFPMTLYEGYFREHKYGLLNQSFGPWFREQLIGLAVSIALAAVFLVPLFALVHWLGRNWWVWGAVLSLVFLALVILIAPVYIAPLFNDYKVLRDPTIRDPILSMARANGIPATDVYEFDASKQSDRVSANVSGLGHTMRISLNDNLLKRCTLPEIQTTMGHEIGHYVLNHLYKSLALHGIMLVVGFAFLNWGILYALKRWGEAWGIRGITDVAVLPLGMVLIVFFFFVTTPIDNTITRTMEFEADMYGLNAARQPDAEANVDLLLGEYRKMEPGPWEEMIFFDHPSGLTRITAAMQWKAEHPETASPEEIVRPMFPEKK